MEEAAQEAMLEKNLEVEIKARKAFATMAEARLRAHQRDDHHSETLAKRCLSDLCYTYSVKNTVMTKSVYVGHWRSKPTKRSSNKNAFTADDFFTLVGAGVFGLLVRAAVFS